MSDESRLVVGCMSGTSMDGIDCALVEVQGEGLGMSARFVRGSSGPLGDGAGVLKRLASGDACTADEITQAARGLAIAHVAVIREAVGGGDGIDVRAGNSENVSRKHDDDAPIAFVCVHGQTVFHAPPLSWQVMNAAVIAAEMGVPVVHDLRAMDLALGGQGAPITPIADWVLFGGENQKRPGAQHESKSHTGHVACVINLGGFANATIWEEGAGVESIRGFDICACNQVLDALARERLGSAYDKDGASAMRGRVDEEALGRIRSLLERQWREGRSLGTGDEAWAVVQRETARLGAEDACATAAGAIGSVVAMAVDQAAGRTQGARRIMLAGGGARNAALREAIAVHSCVRDPRTTVATTAERGVPIEMREAVCFAVLGALCQDGVAITLPQVTKGRPGVISGSWTGLRDVRKGR